MEKIYTSIFKAADFDRILASAICRKKISEAGYLRLQEDGNIDQELWYFVYKDSQFKSLDSIYFGSILLIKVEEHVGGIMREEKMTDEQYQALRSAGKIIPGVWYSIYTDYAHRNLVAVYNGTKLILQGSDTGPTGFPYTFPITF